MSGEAPASQASCHVCRRAQVWLSAWATLTVQNLAFIVQSASFTAEHLEARCEAFVGAMRQLLAGMSEEAFASHVRGPRELCFRCSGREAMGGSAGAVVSAGSAAACMSFQAASRITLYAAMIGSLR